MRIVVPVAASLLLWPALTGCTAAGPRAPTGQAPHALVVAEARSDVGNDRPQVSYDGRMVRRRIVIAVHLDRAGDLAAVRRHLEHTAAHIRTAVAPISASVLDPLPLEVLAPDLVVALPTDETPADGRRLMRLALRGGHWTSTVEAYDVLRVLVHDLRFTVSTAHPARLSRAIAREGIVSDALGNYTTRPGIGTLDILYTGPLLSDDLLRSVVAAIARRAFVRSAAVSIAPRTLTGVGVDLAQEPIPTPVEISAPAHDHDH
jgi:hypothetical protein